MSETGVPEKPRMMWERYRVSGNKHATEGGWAWREVPISARLARILGPGRPE